MRVRRLGERILSRMNPPVFLGAAGLVVAFVAFGGGFPREAYALFGALQAFIVGHFGWFYVLIATGLLAWIVWLLFDSRGDIRLGPPDARPEFHLLTWFSMLMAAGMGIGVVFFGVSEPVRHFLAPPLAGEGGSPEALRQAMRFTYYHWGLHPWAIYSAIALPLAYFHFRHGLPLAPRSLLYPLIGERIHGGLGHAVDILCTVGTLFGVATSLGLGSVQINAGLHELFGVPQGRNVQIALIAGITAVATVSVVSGLHRGIRTLSQLNMSLAGLLLVFVLVAGPTVFILELFVSSFGTYLQHLPETSFWVAPASGRDWQGDWTLFYWSWWISWSPFVGVFVARISKGRTIREFVLALLLVPTLLAFLWFAAMGGTGVHLEMAGQGGIADATRDGVRGSSFFAVLGALPFAELTQVLAVLLVVVFFVTSSDSGSLVDDMVTSGGHPDPPRAQRLFWALAEGAVAATLLLAGSPEGGSGETGLRALRTASLTTGLPMAVFLVVGCYGLARALRVDVYTRGRPEVERLAEPARGEADARVPGRDRPAEGEPESGEGGAESGSRPPGGREEPSGAEG